MPATTPALPSIRRGPCRIDRESEGYVGTLAVTGDEDQLKLLAEVLTRFRVVEALNEAVLGNEYTHLHHRRPIVLRTIDDPRGMYLWIPGAGSWSTAKRRVDEFIKIYENDVLAECSSETLSLIWDISTSSPEDARLLIQSHERAFRATYLDEAVRASSS